jgi:hypothetical protein
MPADTPPVSGTSPEDVKAAMDAAFEKSAKITMYTTQFQSDMAAMNASREASTAAFNSSNRAVEEIQSR